MPKPPSNIAQPVVTDVDSVVSLTSTLPPVTSVFSTPIPPSTTKQPVSLEVESVVPDNVQVTPEITAVPLSVIPTFTGKTMFAALLPRKVTISFTAFAVALWCPG
jgi:hypothetical protein